MSSDDAAPTAVSAAEATAIPAPEVPAAPTPAPVTAAAAVEPIAETLKVEDATLDAADDAKMRTAPKLHAPALKMTNELDDGAASNEAAAKKRPSSDSQFSERRDEVLDVLDAKKAKQAEKAKKDAEKKAKTEAEKQA